MRDTAHAQQIPGLFADQFENTLPPIGQGLAVFALKHAAGTDVRHRVDQRKLVRHAQQLIDARQQGRGVGHRGGGNAADVARNRPLQLRQPRLGGTRNAQVGAFERGHQRLHAAGQLGLLLGQAYRRLDVHHQIFIARTRQALDQVLKLGALQGHLTELDVRHRQPGRCVARQFLRLARDGARFHRLHGRIGTLAGELFPHAGQALPHHAGCHQRRQRQHQSQ